jgi:hypothetical protein
MRDTNTSDITEPSKFSGEDHHWDEFHYQLRTYLATKGWLSTYDHPTGPGTPNFDLHIKVKLYNKLTMLCVKGTAITYLRKAAEFDGWVAGQQLRLRYHGFSKQRGNTLRKTVENLRHVHGTNICSHIDLFEKLCTQMAQNDPANPPSEDQKIEWFLDTVTERTYESVQATCSDVNIGGTLTFNRMVKLFTHKCFQKYPDFQIQELVNPKHKTSISNNSTYVKGGRSNRKGKGKGRGHPQSSDHRSNDRNREKGKASNHGQHKRPNKGKGKGKSRGRGNRTRDPCSYCAKDGHEARECRKRISDEKKKEPQSNNAQHVTHLEVDETAIMFTQNAVYLVEPDDVPQQNEGEQMVNQAEITTINVDNTQQGVELDTTS